MSKTITLPMSEAQYATARTALLSNSEVTSHTETSATAGSFATSQVSMDYSFDGSNLQLEVTAQHGIAKFASLETIKDHVADLLKEIPQAS